MSRSSVFSSLASQEVTAAEFDKLDGVTASTDELNTLAGYTGTTAELNVLTGGITTLGAVTVGSLGSGVTGTGSWVKLGDTQTVTSAHSSVTIGWNSTTATTRFVSTYKIYKIIMSDMVVSANDKSTRSQAYVGSSGTPATPTLYAGGSHYTNVYFNQTTNSGALTNARFNDQAYWSALAGGKTATGGLLEYYPSNTTDGVHNYAEITLYNPSGTSNLKCGRTVTIYFDSSNEIYNKSESGFFLHNTSSPPRDALSAFSIYPSSGTFIDGTFDLYGIA